MKKFVFLTVLILSLVACSSDKVIEENPESELSITIENLVGTWLAVESHEISTASDPISFQPIEEEDRYIYKFSHDFTVTAIDIDPNITHQGNYTIAGNQVGLNFENGEILDLYIISFTENELIISRDFGFEGIIIKFERQNQ